MILARLRDVACQLMQPFQMLNTMNLIWAFDFKESVDPVTKSSISVDLFDYHKASTRACEPKALFHFLFPYTSTNQERGPHLGLCRGY